jgi:DNA-directed RNA polymerase specialized sigma24 family protein
MVEHNIVEHIDIIKRYARVGLAHMHKPTDYTLDDMIQEGAKVFIKAAAADKGKSKFTTFLRTCLRNKYVSMMKKSFSDVKESTDRLRDVHNGNGNITHEQVVESRDFINNLMNRLGTREREYVAMVLSNVPRKEIRGRMRVSFNTEAKIRKSILVAMIGSGYRL